MRTHRHTKLRFFEIFFFLIDQCANVFNQWFCIHLCLPASKVCWAKHEHICRHIFFLGPFSTFFTFLCNSLSMHLLVCICLEPVALSACVRVCMCMSARVCVTVCISLCYVCICLRIARANMPCDNSLQSSFNVCTCSHTLYTFFLFVHLSYCCHIDLCLCICAHNVLFVFVCICMCVCVCVCVCAYTRAEETALNVLVWVLIELFSFHRCCVCLCQMMPVRIDFFR